MIRPVAVILAVAAGVVLTVAPSSSAPPLAQRPTDPAPEVVPATSTPVAAPRAVTTQTLPLAGVRIGLDPGHQLGNSRFPAKIGRLVPAGGFLKPCNTTGTATNSGYPEASLNFAIVRSVQVRLEKLGAQVFLTRSVNSADTWGPCVDVRGRFGAKVGADLVVSVHGDGAPSADRGFHVITPASRVPWTTDIAGDSRRLAIALRDGFDHAGLPRSNYINHGYGLNTRWDLATLNLSDVPVAMVEVGNMRNATDARRMTSVAGRVRYAEAVVAGIRGYLGR
ncbi:MAG: N-acetylmuramoyl-L-alanine amidase [Marmoricola sp.]